MTPIMPVMSIMPIISGRGARAALLGAAGVGLALVGAAGSAEAQSLAIDLGGEEGGAYTARLIQLIVGITVLSVAPGLLIMGTSFVRIVVVLSILRSALGLQQTPPNMVLVSIALLLTGFVMAPTFERAWSDGMQPMMDGALPQEEALPKVVEPFREFMIAQVDLDDLQLFEDLAAESAAPTGTEQAAGAPPAFGQPETATLLPEADTTAGGEGGLLESESGNGALEPVAEAEPEVGLRVLVPAFMTSELSRAFEIGFLIFMPFLVIDLVIAAVLMSMGMMMLPPAIISMPFKIIFFVLIDGWRMISTGLVQSFIF
ncbi:MAG: flagellar type III secretion system pore protein FliP [Pseudomonadota bacterium]